MMWKLLCAPLLLLLWRVSESLAENICTHHLRTVAARQSDFVHCSTMHSVPVELCMGCEEPYTNMLLAYSALREDKNCTEKYFDKDRINIVAFTQSILAGLWTRAYCDDCFTTNNSFVFDMKTTALTDCFTKHKGDECRLCLVPYLDLNTFYTDLDKSNNFKICYDMQDSMNRTRSKWSKELKCSHHEFDMTLFLVASSIFALLPLLFYSGVFALTKRNERNHGLLNEDPELHNSATPSVITAALPGSSSTATLPGSSSTATLPPANTPTPLAAAKNKLRNDSYSTTDESDLDEYTNAKPLAQNKLS